MARSPLHRYLREVTAEAHADLEALVGELQDLSAYKRYVAGLSAFRAPVETSFASADWTAFGDWRPTLIGRSLAADRIDLGLAGAAAGPPAFSADYSARIGTLYVLEGSSLGARLILRTVRPLGLTEKFGARHLHRQAATLDNWHAFITLLERDGGGIDPAAAGQSACQTFAAGRAAMQASRSS